MKLLFDKGYYDCWFGYDKSPYCEQVLELNFPSPSNYSGRLEDYWLQMDDHLEEIFAETDP